MRVLAWLVVPLAMTALVGLVLGLAGIGPVLVANGLFLMPLPLATCLGALAVGQAQSGRRSSRMFARVAAGFAAAAFCVWLLLFIVPLDGPGVEDLGNILGLLMLGGALEGVALVLLAVGAVQRAATKQTS